MRHGRLVLHNSRHAQTAGSPFSLSLLTNILVPPLLSCMQAAVLDTLLHSAFDRKDRAALLHEACTAPGIPSLPPPQQQQPGSTDNGSSSGSGSGSSPLGRPGSSFLSGSSSPIPLSPDSLGAFQRSGLPGQRQQQAAKSKPPPPPPQPVLVCTTPAALLAEIQHRLQQLQQQAGGTGSVLATGEPVQEALAALAEDCAEYERAMGGRSALERW